jgi:flagellar hook-basal body complex protein FliE
LGKTQHCIIAGVSMISDRMDINRVLAEMRSIKAQAQSPQNIVADKINERPTSLSEGVRPVSDSTSFSDLMSRAVNNVNELQKTSGSLATAYEQGQSGVDITDVMIASQKSSVSFQAMVQVRNKLIDAYRDVMNMPV